MRQVHIQRLHALIGVLTSLVRLQGLCLARFVSSVLALLATVKHSSSKTDNQCMCTAGNHHQKLYLFPTNHHGKETNILYH